MSQKKEPAQERSAAMQWWDNLPDNEKEELRLKYCWHEDFPEQIDFMYEREVIAMEPHPDADLWAEKNIAASTPTPSPNQNTAYYCTMCRDMKYCAENKVCLEAQQPWPNQDSTGREVDWKKEYQGTKKLLDHYKHLVVKKDETIATLPIEFAKWLTENTEIIREEKITLYRYCDAEGYGNYILDDIYTVFMEKWEPSASKEEAPIREHTPEEKMIIAAAKYGFVYRDQSQNHGDVPDGNILQWLQWYKSTQPQQIEDKDREIERLQADLKAQIEQTKDWEDTANDRTQVLNNMDDENQELKRQLASIQAKQPEQVSGAGWAKDLTAIRNELYESLPKPGKLILTKDLIRRIKWHINDLDNFMSLTALKASPEISREQFVARTVDQQPTP